MDDKLHDQPSEVVAHEGQVLIDGPDGVSIAMTAEAAIETAERLQQAAIMAKGQIASRPAKRRPI